MTPVGPPGEPYSTWSQEKADIARVRVDTVPFADGAVLGISILGVSPGTGVFTVNQGGFF